MFFASATSFYHDDSQLSELCFRGRQRRKVQNELDRRADNIAIIQAQFCSNAPHSSWASWAETVINALDIISNTGDYREPGEAFTLGQEARVAVEDVAVCMGSVFKKGKKS